MHELGLKRPFQNLLDKAAKKRGWTLGPELATYSGGKRIVPDGTVGDEFRLACGWWEAKDTSEQGHCGSGCARGPERDLPKLPETAELVRAGDLPQYGQIEYEPWQGTDVLLSSVAAQG